MISITGVWELNTHKALGVHKSLVGSPMVSQRPDGEAVSLETFREEPYRQRESEGQRPAEEGLGASQQALTSDR